MLFSWVFIIRALALKPDLLGGARTQVPSSGSPILGVLIIRILLFRVLY